MVPVNFNFRQDFKVLYLLKYIANNEMTLLGTHIIWEFPLYFKGSQVQVPLYGVFLSLKFVLPNQKV